MEKIQTNQLVHTVAEKPMTIVIQGHKVTLSFAKESDPSIAPVIKRVLLNSYVQSTGFSSKKGNV